MDILGLCALLVATSAALPAQANSRLMAWATTRGARGKLLWRCRVGACVGILQMGLVPGSARPTQAKTTGLRQRSRGRPWQRPCDKCLLFQPVGIEKPCELLDCLKQTTCRPVDLPTALQAGSDRLAVRLGSPCRYEGGRRRVHERTLSRSGAQIALITPRRFGAPDNLVLVYSDESEGGRGAVGKTTTVKNNGDDVDVTSCTTVWQQATRSLTQGS